MTKKVIRIMVTAAVGIAIVVVLSTYVPRWGILGLFAMVILGQIGYYFLFKTKGEAKLQYQVDADKYDRFIEEKYKDRKQNLYNLMKSYVLVHQGKLQEAENNFNQYEENYLLKNRAVFYIYIKIKVELAFFHQDLSEIKKIKEEFKMHAFYVDYVETFMEVFELLLENKHEKARDLMFEIIPKQKTRLDIIELEYYLAYCYKVLNLKEDLIAVAEFVTSKQYNVVYTQLCQELLDEAKEN